MAARKAILSVEQTDEDETKAALQALGDAVQRAVEESGLSEDELADPLTI
ncbi:MAG: hypothetical protein U5L04_08685 [Trueperaceae bacterium]|nr:hypothetical protein [Trueperaceae bacterium]